MGTKIYKIQVEVYGLTTVTAAGCRPLFIGVQHDKPFMWYEHYDNGADEREFHFETRMTGQYLPAGAEYVGSFQIGDAPYDMDGKAEGYYVGHVYRLTP